MLPIIFLTFTVCETVMFIFRRFTCNSTFMTLGFVFRMQSQVLELNGKIESVNRERKYHQVIQKNLPFLLSASLYCKGKNHQEKWFFFFFFVFACVCFWVNVMFFCNYAAKHGLWAHCFIYTMERALFEKYWNTSCLCWNWNPYWRAKEWSCWKVIIVFVI